VTQLGRSLLARLPAPGPLALLALIGALGLAAPARAQSVSGEVSLSVDRTQVEVGGMLRLTVQAHVRGASASNVQLPDLSAFDVVSRQVSNPFSLRFGFGGAQQHVESRTRHSLVLRAREPGTFEIGPASVAAGGRTFRSNTVTVTVGAGGATSGSDPQGAPDPATGPPPADRRDGMQYDPRGFVRTWVDHGEPYLGQQVTVTVYLYTRDPLRGSPTITQEPSTEGFWTRDLLPPSRTLRGERQRLNGRTFHVYVLRRFAAFPLETGELTIGPTSVTVTQGGIFGIFGGGRTEPLSRTGVPVTLDVRELPEAGRPPGEVHVGSLALEAELDRPQVATGDAVTLTVTAEGRGPIEQVRIPPPSGDGLRVLQPEIRDEISTPDDVVRGRRTYRWLIVPERPGEHTLGPFEVPVFDPGSGTYSTARAPALTLTAAGAAVDGAAPEATARDEAAPAEAGEAPRFAPIRTRSALSRTHTLPTRQPWFLALLALGPLAFGGALLFRLARGRARRADPKHAPKRARRAAQKQLAAARDHARANAPREFYAAVSHALEAVLQAKLGHPVGSFTHAELRRVLGERGMDEALAGRVMDELEGCEFARFSAVGVSGEEMERCLSRARELLAELDRFTPTSPEEES
jgi:hypothetical protein